MQVEIQLDEACREPKIIIVTDKMTKEVSQLAQSLSETKSAVLAGFQGDTLKILEQSELIRVYASAGRVYAKLDSGEYRLRLRLYEVEERLDKNSFVRISNSEIINLKKVKHFDLSFSGTICVCLTDGTTTYASRRYVAKMKKVLGI